MNETLYKYDATYDIFYPTNLENELRLEKFWWQFEQLLLRRGERE
jgi:hypothetical protein